MKLGLAAAALVLAAGCSSGGAAEPGTSSQVLAVAPSNQKLPPAGGRFSYQIGGAYPVPAGVRIVDRDRTAAAVPGTYSICYINAFQAQPDAVGWWRQHHNDLLLRRNGHLVIDQDWNEPLLDLRRPSELLDVVGAWVDGCAKAGFQAVEADNLDSYTRSDDLLTRTEALAFGRLLAARAHQDRLALGQKNAADLSSAARAAGFDFAIAEECQVFAECGSYTDVYGRELIEIEYTDQSSRFFAQACADRGHTVSVVRRDREVTPVGDPARVEQWC